ncbi:MAG: 3-deoxy-8-phosphooctulonate synthase [Oligoflexales bacterium]|nr:3-deoxy-8-phosphooctulonate synthase [Oligoflexales bacterium]
MTSASKPVIIAGPCMAESPDIMDSVAARLSKLAESLGFTFYFKASFDKANRSSINSYRGPGLEESLPWFKEIKAKYGCRLITDIHEPHQAATAAEVFDALQIPAFLCRQTDLLVAAVATGRMVNIKKGQFMSPDSMRNIADKVRQTCEQNDLELNASLTERGTSFGYGDLLVDMRSFPMMANFGLPLIFDVTHSTQTPPTGDAKTSGANRKFAPILARSAAATGCLDGFFIEVHPEPSKAKSDAAAQLNIEQAEALISQLVPIWKDAKKWRELDSKFES